MFEILKYVALGIAAGFLASIRRNHTKKIVDSTIGATEGLLLALSGNWAVPGAMAIYKVVQRYREKPMTVGDMIATGVASFAAATLPKDVTGIGLILAAIIDPFIGIPFLQATTGAAVAVTGSHAGITITAYVIAKLATDKAWKGV